MPGVAERLPRGQAELLGRPTFVLCHHDPLLLPLVGAVVTDAERRLRDRLGQDRYLRLDYGESVDVLG
jgi:hypothetical protein